jgi:hypothetical protein
MISNVMMSPIPRSLRPVAAVQHARRPRQLRRSRPHLPPWHDIRRLRPPPEAPRRGPWRRTAFLLVVAQQQQEHGGRRQQDPGQDLHADGEQAQRAARDEGYDRRDRQTRRIIRPLERQDCLSDRIAGLPLKKRLHPFNILSAVESVLLFIFVEISGRPDRQGEVLPMFEDHCATVTITW